MLYLVIRSIVDGSRSRTCPEILSSFSIWDPRVVIIDNQFNSYNSLTNVLQGMLRYTGLSNSVIYLVQFKGNKNLIHTDSCLIHV